MAVQAVAAKTGGKKAQSGIGGQVIAVLLITLILGAGLLAVLRAVGAIDIDFGAVLARVKGLAAGVGRGEEVRPAVDEAELGRLTEEAARAAAQREQIAALEAEIAGKDELIKNLQAEVERLKKEAAASPAAADLVVAVYGEMKPADAARIMAKLDEALVTNILRQLEAGHAARILSEMEVTKAARIVNRMAR